MRDPLGKRGPYWLGTGLVLLAASMVALLWLRAASVPDVGVRLESPRLARAPGVGDGLLGRDPVGSKAKLDRECPVRGDCVVDFSYRDEKLLQETQTGGGRVWIPAIARQRGGPYPLVVLLHGTDSMTKPGGVHRLLAPPLDLSLEFKSALERGVAVPVIVAAPSQTRDAHASPSLWTSAGFNLADFVTVLEAELSVLGSARVDRRRVSVFGHSGAGCVVTSRKRNGLFHVAERVRALRNQGVHVTTLGLMDICFHGYGGGRFLRDALAGTSTRVAAMWVEPQTWYATLDRDPDGFARGLGVSDVVRCDRTRFESCLGNDRGWWLFKARHRPLAQGAQSGSRSPPGDDDLDAHSAMTRWFVQEILRRHLSGKIGH